MKTVLLFVVGFCLLCGCQGRDENAGKVQENTSSIAASGTSSSASGGAESSGLSEEPAVTTGTSSSLSAAAIERAEPLDIPALLAGREVLVGTAKASEDTEAAKALAEANVLESVSTLLLYDQDDMLEGHFARLVFHQEAEAASAYAAYLEEGTPAHQEGKTVMVLYGESPFAEMNAQQAQSLLEEHGYICEYVTQ